MSMYVVSFNFCILSLLNRIKIKFCYLLNKTLFKKMFKLYIAGKFTLKTEYNMFSCISIFCTMIKIEFKVVTGNRFLYRMNFANFLTLTK